MLVGWVYDPTVFLILAVALIPSLVQESDEDTRARIRAKVDRLAGEDIEDRDRAAAELLKIPVRYAPYIADLGARLGPRAAAVLERLSIPAPWPEFLKGTIHESRELIARISGGEAGRNSAAAGQALKDLSLRPSDHIQRILSGLWSSSNPRFREFAVDGWVKWPPVDRAQLRPLLSDPAFEKQVASILILAGDFDAVPVALADYEARRRNGSRTAMRILAAFGVPDADMDRILDVWKGGEVTEAQDFWILGRRGSEKGAKYLAEWIKSSGPGSAQAVPVLAWIGGEAQMHAVRQWASDNVKEKYVPWPIHDPAAAARRFASLGPEPTSQDFINKLYLSWQAGPALRDPIVALLAKPGLRLNPRRQMLRMLGQAGRAEDAAILLESLRDPRLADAAAEALGMMGDPAHARPLFEAVMRIGDSRFLGPAVIGLPVGTYEDLLIEVISDADSYEQQASVAVILAGRRLTPALRDVLLKTYPGCARIWPAAEAVLLHPSRRQDRELLAQLSASPNPGLKAIGALLELQSGKPDGAAAAALVAKTRALGMRADIGRPWLDGCEEEAWREAVAAEWKKDRAQPSTCWPFAVWLAERGDPLALEDARARLTGPPSVTTASDLQALAIGGEAADLHKVFDLCFDAKLKLERLEPPLRFNPAVGAKLPPDLRGRILDRARAEAPHQPTGLPLRRALFLAAQCELPEGVPLYRYVVSFTHAEQTSTTAEEQVACIRALVGLNDAASIPLLRIQVRSLQPTVRAAAMDALAAFKDRDAAARIARYIEDPSPMPRPTTYEWGSYTYHPIRRVWHHAMEALEKITGEKPPPGSVMQHREFWRAWAAKNP